MDNDVADCLSRNYLVLDDNNDMSIYKTWMIKPKSEFGKRYARMQHKLQDILKKMLTDAKIADGEVVEETNGGSFI